MSQENVELVQKFVEATNRRDADAFVANLSPDVEWEDTLFWTEGPRTYRGRAGVRKWLDEIQGPWEDLHLEVDEIVETSDGRLLVEFGLSARGRVSGADTQLRFWTVLWLADGMVTRRRSFHEEAAALKAAGLED